MATKLQLSLGAQWVLNRLPDDVFDTLKEDIESLIHDQMSFVGYDAEVKTSFKESKPALLERK